MRGLVQGCLVILSVLLRLVKHMAFMVVAHVHGDQMKGC